MVKMGKSVSGILTVMILFHQKANPTVKMLLAQTLVRAYKGLSRMRGNLHVRFLGGGGAVMRCCYPTSSPTRLCAENPGQVTGVFLCLSAAALYLMIFLPPEAI
ncbi:Uncharacterised protein [Serratia marcescens]|nr:Uncharacterised protein [Serratia marcescens]CAI1026069.1 Uncharacterised protein [Serratia marcescens]